MEERHKYNTIIVAKMIAEELAEWTSKAASFSDDQIDLEDFHACLMSWNCRKV